MRFSKDKHLSALKLLYENELEPAECIEIMSAIEEFNRFDEDDEDSATYNILEEWLLTRFIPHDIFNMSCEYVTDILPVKGTNEYQYCLRTGISIIPYLSLL